MNFRNQPGLTLTEMAVAIGIAGVLLWTAITSLRVSAYRGHGTQMLSNMMQLHLATQSMALDGTTTGNTNLNWPGDTGGTFVRWAILIVGEGYLTQHDFCNLLSGPGKTIPRKFMPAANTNAILVYAVRETSPSEATYLTSANFTNTPTGGAPLHPDAKPFGDKSFVVFRKGGDGAILIPRAIGHTNQIGLFVPLCR